MSFDNMRSFDQSDELIQKLVARPDDGVVANDLLKAFFGGYAVEKLRLLLVVDNEQTLKTGVWLASELGIRAKPLMEFVAPHLSHASTYVRYFAIECVLSCATGADGFVVARVVSLVNDAELAIRNKVMEFLACASIEQLSSAGKYLPRGDEDIAAGLKLLLEGNPGRAEIASFLNSNSAARQRFGAAAAARSFEYDEAPIHDASLAVDDEIRNFASQWLSARRKATNER